MSYFYQTACISTGVNIMVFYNLYDQLIVSKGET